jgi:hypothetical protein
MCRLLAARRARLAISIAALALGFGVVGVHANSLNHNTTGTGGGHTDGSHLNNPSHIWVSVGAGGGGTISSGGRFHSNCGSARCYSTFGDPPADWALDIDTPAGEYTARLYLDYAGWGTGYTYPPNNNRDIYIHARVAAQGNYRSPERAMCYWQKYDIYTSYYDTSGAAHTQLVVGHVWMAHVYQFSYATGQWITNNASHQNPYGTGYVYHVSGIPLGSVYDGGDPNAQPCSSGSHIHQEVYSTHAWGAEYEWHSSSGPDGYNGLAGISDHIHGPGGTGYSSTSVSQGQTIGFVGGGTTLFWMRDNPNYSGF